MFFRLLDFIRTKPVAQRQQYALGGAIVVTLAITGVWSLSLPDRFAAIGERLGTTTEAATQTASVPFSGLWQQLQSYFRDPLNSNSPLATTTNDLSSIIATFETATSIPNTEYVVTTSTHTQIELPSGSVITIIE